MEKRHRIFVAINLPEEIKKELFSYSEKWAELPAKWTDKNNLHITLEFLGALTDEEIGEVCVIVKEVAERHSCFSLSINQVLYGPPKKMPPRPPKFLDGKKDNKSDGQEDAFEDNDFKSEEKFWRPRMVWAEGEKSKELAAIREDLENSLTEKVRFVPENRTFAPHITLARISSWEWKQIEPEERPEVNENIDLPFTVESIEVMESVLKRGGPVYTILESHQLKS
jgi:2'-5' RNA ligase